MMRLKIQIISPCAVQHSCVTKLTTSLQQWTPKLIALQSGSMTIKHSDPLCRASTTQIYPFINKNIWLSFAIKSNLANCYYLLNQQRNKWLRSILPLTKREAFLWRITQQAKDRRQENSGAVGVYAEQLQNSSTSLRYHCLSRKIRYLLWKETKMIKAIVNL